MTGALPAQPSRWRAAAHLAIFVAIFILAAFLSYLLAPIPPGQGRQLSPQIMLLAEGQLLAGGLIATPVNGAVQRRGIWSYGLDDSPAFPRVMVGGLSGNALDVILVGRPLPL